jgi:hypothetical protein
MKSNIDTVLKEIIKIKTKAGFLQKDFEMLEDGSWDMNYSDGSEIQASLDNCKDILKATENLLKLVTDE